VRGRGNPHRARQVYFNNIREYVWVVLVVAHNDPCCVDKDVEGLQRANRIGDCGPVTNVEYPKANLIGGANRRCGFAFSFVRASRRDESPKVAESARTSEANTTRSADD
jgi:hypothetical protein